MIVGKLSQVSNVKANGKEGILVGRTLVVVNEIFSDSIWFSTIDLASGSWHVAVDHASKEKAASTSLRGLPFRLLGLWVQGS